MAKKRKISGSSGKDFLKQIIVLLTVNLVLHLFLKYKLNSLSITDYSFSALGNWFNIGTALISIFGVLAVTKFAKASSCFNQKPALAIIIITTLVYLLLFAHEYFKMGVPSFLSGITTVKRIYYMYLFIFIQISQFYILSLIISAFFSEKKFIYLKAFFKMLFISIAFILFSFFYSVLKKHGDEKFERDKEHTGIVLGAAVLQGNKPSPVFEGRIKKAFEMYKNHFINRIQVTGSNAPGEKSEAKTASDYLVKLGVDKKDVVIEEKSSNTVEQIAYIKKRYSGSGNPTKFIIISDEFHLVRALEICSFFDINAETAASEYNITSEKLLYYRLRESAALLLFWFFAV